MLLIDAVEYIMLNSPHANVNGVPLNEFKDYLKKRPSYGDKQVSLYLSDDKTVISGATEIFNRFKNLPTLDVIL